LRQQDLEASLSYLRELYAQRDLESFKRHILTTIGSIVPSESVIYVDPSASVTVDDPGGTSGWESEPAFSSPDLPEIVEIHGIYIDENPLINHYRRTLDGRAVQITDFLTQSEFRRLGLYNDVFRRVGLDQWMTIVLPHGPLAATAVSLGRSDKDFSERDRLALNQLRPHLLQAYNNAAALTRMQLESARMKQAVEKLDRAVVVVGEKGGCNGAHSGPNGGSRSTSGRPKRRVTYPATCGAGSNTNGRLFWTSVGFRCLGTRWSSSVQESASLYAS
jgi:hypothetical protein